MPLKRYHRNQIYFRRGRRALIHNLSAIVHKITGIGKAVASTIRRIRRRDQVLAIILLGIWVGLLFSNFYVRGVSRFEGNLITKTMSFTYTGEVDKQFLNSLDLPTLSLQGQQPRPIILRGRFSSLDNPALNAQLKPLTQLEIQLSNPQSGLNIETANPKQPNSIGLQQLRLLPNSRVDRLTYQANPHQLKFCLQSSFAAANSCENTGTSQSTATVLGQLEFGINPSSMNLFLANVKIPALSIDEFTLETQLRWVPEGQEFILPISSSTLVQVGLPEITKKPSEEIVDDLTQLIRGDIQVKQVQFSKLDRSGNVNDTILNSDILDGEVRMMGQSLKLQSRQFLIIPVDHEFDKPNCRMSPSQNPGIHRLRDIRLNIQNPKGLQTFISGESKCLSIGLYQEFPTQSIEPSWLLKYVPQEGVNAIYTLIGAFTGILFPRLFPEQEEPKK